MILEPVFMDLDELGATLSWRLICVYGWLPVQHFTITSKPNGILLVPITDDQKPLANDDTNVTE